MKTKTVDKEPKTIVDQLGSIEKILMRYVVSLRKVFNSREAASYLNYTQGHIYHLVKKERLPHYRVKGNRLSFRKKELNFWLIKRQKAPSDFPSSEPLALHKND